MAYRIGVSCSLGIGPEKGGREQNEDNYLVATGGNLQFLDSSGVQQLYSAGEGAVLAVCDGMGGHEDGQVASETAVRVISKLYQPGVPANPERTLLRYVRESHERLHWKTAEAGASMGTTLVVAWLLRGTFSWVNVGDSRLYRYRDDTLELLTLDHTRNEFARRDGRPEVAPELDHLSQNFIFGSRGLGDNASLRLEPGLDSGTEPLEPGDVLLLCSDGVWDFVDSERIADILQRNAEPQVATDTLVQAAMNAGSNDNLTALVVLVMEQKPPEVAWTDDFDVLRTL